MATKKVNPTKRVLFIGGLVAFVAGLTYVIVKQMNKTGGKKKAGLEKEPPIIIKEIVKMTPVEVQNPPAPPVTGIQWVPESFPLKQGMYGDKIKSLQKALNKFYNANLKVDGYWGIKTNDAVLLHLDDSKIEKSFWYALAPAIRTIESKDDDPFTTLGRHAGSVS